MTKEVKTTVTQEVIKGDPAPNTVRVYHADGSVQDMYPIDAKEAVALGDYSYDPVVGGEGVYKPVKPGESGEAVGESQPDFENMTKAELEEWAAAHNVAVTSSMTKAEQIEAIRAGGK